MTHNGKRQALEVWSLSRCVPEAVSSLSVCGVMGRLRSHAVLIWAVPMPLSDSWQSPQKEIENSQKVFYQRQNYILTPFFLDLSSCCSIFAEPLQAARFTCISMYYCYSDCVFLCVCVRVYALVGCTPADSPVISVALFARPFIAGHRTLAPRTTKNHPRTI